MCSLHLWGRLLVNLLLLNKGRHGHRLLLNRRSDLLISGRSRLLDSVRSKRVVGVFVLLLLDSRRNHFLGGHVEQVREVILLLVLILTGTKIVIPRVSRDTSLR